MAKSPASTAAVDTEEIAELVCSFYLSDFFVIRWMLLGYNIMLLS